jgi:hypothetical protein
MKENHRVESLKALSQSGRRKRIRRFESSARVYAYSFDNANESKLSDESSILIYKESQRLDARPPSNRVLRRSNSPSQRPERSWHPGPIQALLTAGSLAFLCVISLLLMQDIHPAPTKLTIQRDAAELVRLEAQLRPDPRKGCHINFFHHGTRRFRLWVLAPLRALNRDPRQRIAGCSQIACRTAALLPRTFSFH